MNTIIKMRLTIVGITLALSLILFIQLPTVAKGAPLSQGASTAQCVQDFQLLFQGRVTEAQLLSEEDVTTLLTSTNAYFDSLSTCALLLGTLYHDIGDWGEALAAYGIQLSAAQEYADPQMEWVAQFGVGTVYVAQGRFVEGYKTLQNTLPLTGSANNADEEACEDTAISAETKEGLWSTEMFKPLARAVNLNNIGMTIALPLSQHQDILGVDYKQAQACFKAALEILYRLEALSVNSGITPSNQSQTLMLNSSDDYDVLSSQVAHILSTDIIPQLARSFEPILLNNLGQTAALTGDMQQAQLYLEQALKQIEANQTRSTINLQAILLGLDTLPDKMRHEVILNVAIIRELLNYAGLAANNYSSKAVMPTNTTLSIFSQVDKIVSLNAKAIVLNNQAVLFNAQEENGEARTAFQGALEIYENQLANYQGAVIVHTNLGWLAQQNGEIVDALKHYQLAIKHLTIIHSIADSTVIREPQTLNLVNIQGILSQHADVYALAINLYLKQGKTVEALQTLEQGRSRLFFDMMSKSNRRLSQQEVEMLNDVQRAFTLYVQTISSLTQARAIMVSNVTQQQDVNTANLQLLVQLEDERKRAEELYLTRLKALEIHNPKLLSLAAGVDMSLDLTTFQTQFLSDTTVIAYFVAEGVLAELTDRLAVAWVIDADEVTTVPLDVNAKMLYSQIQGVRESIEGRDFYFEASDLLYQEIIAPLEPYLKNNNLTFITDGSLNHLPFAALWDKKNQHYLLEDYIISYLPSIHTLPLIQANQNPNDNRLLAMANNASYLPGATREVSTIANFYQTTPITDKAATETRFVADVGDFDLIHLTDSTRYKITNPLSYSIEFQADSKNDGNVTVPEIFDLDLTNANLVVLSSCKTALGEDEITGLTSAFLYAGTPSIITTQWSTEDESSAALMISFYKHLRSGKTISSALRDAQLEILKTSKWSDPYYWAAFGLTGLPIIDGARNPPNWAMFSTTDSPLSDPISLAIQRGTFGQETNAKEKVPTIEDYLQRGNYFQSILSSLQISSTVSDTELSLEQFQVNIDLGKAYMYAEDRIPIQKYSLAEKYFHTAGALAQRMNNLFATITTQSSSSWLKAQSGIVLQNSGRLTEAAKDLERVLEIWKGFKKPDKVAEVLEQLALIALAQSDSESAKTLAQEGLQWAEMDKARIQKSHFYIILGIAGFKSGDNLRAIEDAKQALQLANESNDQLAMLGCHILIAMIDDSQAEYQAAYMHIETIMKGLRSSSYIRIIEQLRTMFLNQLPSIDELAIPLAVETGRNEEALQFAEQFGERNFLEISSQRFDLRLNADPKLIIQEQELRQQMNALTQQLAEESTKPLLQQNRKAIEHLSNNLETHRQAYAELLSLFKASNSNYTTTQLANTLTITDIYDFIDDQTTVIRYVVLQDKTYAFLIDKTSPIQIVTLPITQRALEAQVTYLLNVIDVDQDFLSDVATQLYAILVKPLIPYIRHSNLVIVPDGILHLVPFVALQADNSQSSLLMRLWSNLSCQVKPNQCQPALHSHYLVEDYVMTQIPSVGALRFIIGRRNTNQGRLAAFVDPNMSLPSARQEADQIASLYETPQLLLGYAATENQLYGIGQVDILHFASYVTEEKVDPLFSYIELTSNNNDNDGRLEIHEIYNRLNLDGVNLVVITGGELRSVNADVTTQFAQAFLYAGVSAVMINQWSIKDPTSAVYFMDKFYTYLHTNMEAPEALHRAQLDMIQNPQYANPYYWAGFTLTGDYKNDYVIGSPLTWLWVLSLSSLGTLLLFSIAGVYIRVAKPNKISIPEALQLLRLALTTEGGYLNRNWAEFRYRIHTKLFKDGVVSGDILDGLPASLWTTALQRYYLENPELNLTFYEEEQLIRHRNFELIRSFNRAWENTQQAIQSGRDNSANANQLVQNLGKLIDLQIDHFSNNLTGNMRYAIFDVSPVFPDLPRIQLLPLIIHESTEWRESDLDFVRQVMQQAYSDEHPLATQSIGVLITFAEGAKIQDIRLQLDKKLRQTYSYDVNMLTQGELLRILFQKNIRREFGNVILQNANLEILSPYQIAEPVSPDAFFGRESELRRITENVNRHSYAIIGGRKIGKTSLWHQLHQRKLPGAGFYTAMVDCQAINSYEQFLSVRLQEGQAHLPLQRPVVISDVLAALPFDKPLVLLLDEADKLIEPDRRLHWPLFNQLRTFVNSKRMQIVLLGEYALHSALYDNNGPLYNLAEGMILGTLDENAVEELVTRPMKQLRIDFVDEEAVVEQIYQFTSGHPAIVQSLCNRLVAHLNLRKERTISMADVVAIVEDPQFQEEDFLKVYLAGATALEEIIVLLLVNYTEAQRLTTILKVIENEAEIYPGVEATHSALDRLVKLRSILKNSQEGYEFAVDAFPRVLRNSVTLTDQLAIKIEQYNRERI